MLSMQLSQNTQILGADYCCGFGKQIDMQVTREYGEGSFLGEENETEQNDATKKYIGL